MFFVVGSCVPDRLDVQDIRGKLVALHKSVLVDSLGMSFEVDRSDSEEVRGMLLSDK